MRRGPIYTCPSEMRIYHREETDHLLLLIQNRQAAKPLGTHDLHRVVDILVLTTERHVSGHQVVDVHAISISAIGNQAANNIAVG